jgi:hypothetical protein
VHGVFRDGAVTVRDDATIEGQGSTGSTPKEERQ